MRIVYDSEWCKLRTEDNVHPIGESDVGDKGANRLFVARQSAALRVDQVQPRLNDLIVELNQILSRVVETLKKSLNSIPIMTV